MANVWRLNHLRNQMIAEQEKARISASSTQEAKQ
jgi:hypothetical protein